MRKPQTGHFRSILKKCEKEREKRNERVKKVIKTILGQLESGKRKKGD